MSLFKVCQIIIFGPAPMPGTSRKIPDDWLADCMTIEASYRYEAKKKYVKLWEEQTGERISPVLLSCRRI